MEEKKKKENEERMRRLQESEKRRQLLLMATKRPRGDSSGHGLSDRARTKSEACGSTNLNERMNLEKIIK